jgi:hypothetical protein
VSDEPFKIEHAHHNFHVVTIPPSSPASGDEIFRVLLRSDTHHDSPHNLWGMEKRHLDEAVKRGAAILDNGDTFDLMQTRHDPRREMGGKKPEQERLNYLDLAIEEAINDYEPYARNWVMFGEGNHESTIIKNLGSDPLERLVGGLRDRTHTYVRRGGYFGHVRFRFALHNTRISKLLTYYHGHGGGAPVTQGVIHSQRNSRKYPDSNIVWTGHQHVEWAMTWERYRVGRQNKLYQDDQLHICTPGYKRIENPTRGFEVERCGNEPKPVGAAWLTFTWDRATKDVHVDRLRAK